MWGQNLYVLVEYCLIYMHQKNYLFLIIFFLESYSQAVNNPVTPSLQALKRQSPPASPSIKKKHGIRSSFGKGLLKRKRHKSSSEPNIGIDQFCSCHLARYELQLMRQPTVQSN